MKKVKEALEQVKETKLYDQVTSWLSKREGGIVMFIVLSILWGIALIPTWLSLFLYWLISPATFWQTFATIVVMLFFLGSFQLFTGGVAVVITLSLLTSENF